MLEQLKFESTILLKDLPIQWISRIELYYPDLMGFPIVYVHCKSDGKRLYGFPASISYKIKDDRHCDTEILFLCNADLNSDRRAKDVISHELMERFGTSGSVSKADVIASCNGNKSYELFFEELWKHISKIMGESVPYGKFFEEIYSIVRFVSAWQPKTGRQSEMRMLYNFLSIFGEKMEVGGRWQFVEFYLLPSYDDILIRNFAEFPKFSTLFGAMEKTWKEYFIISVDLNGTTIRSMKNAWPQNKDTFINKVSNPLAGRGSITSEERFSLERLVDAFNRHPWRAAFFIWSIMTIWSKDYRKWDKKFFIDFYLSKAGGAGISEKVLACFLQQGFGNEEVIPIDTWVESFYQMALGIKDKAEFLNSFSKMGKLERLIWLVSQGRKTNMGAFFNMLWCIRFGVTGNRELRGPNPISCYECILRPACPSYEKMTSKMILVRETQSVQLIGGQLPSSVINDAEKSQCSYVCLTDNAIPKKIFQKRGKRWRLTDEFSGYILQSRHRTKIKNTVVTIKQLMDSLPPFMVEDIPEIIDEE